MLKKKVIILLFKIMCRCFLKVLIAAVLLSMPLWAGAQQLAKKGDKVESLVPDGWTYVEAEGDLNKDGLNDLVLITIPDFEQHLVRRDDGYVYNFNKPILAVYFGEKGQGYVFWRQYEDAILPRPNEFLSYDYTLKITPRATFIITIESFASAGSWSSVNSSYTYRYQNGDFYMIGRDYSSYARNTGEAEEISWNYLTHKCQRIKHNVFDDKVKPVEKWSRIPASPLEKLGDTTLPDD